MYNFYEQCTIRGCQRESQSLLKPLLLNQTNSFEYQDFSECGLICAGPAKHIIRIITKKRRRRWLWNNEL